MRDTEFYVSHYFTWFHPANDIAWSRCPSKIDKLCDASECINCAHLWSTLCLTVWERYSSRFWKVIATLGFDDPSPFDTSYHCSLLIEKKTAPPGPPSTNTFEIGIQQFTKKTLTASDAASAPSRILSPSVSHSFVILGRLTPLSPLPTCNLFDVAPKNPRKVSNLKVRF